MSNKVEIYTFNDKNERELDRILDFIEYLQFKLDIIEGKHEGDFYVENEHGGATIIDEYGYTITEPFPQVSTLLRDIVKAQITKKILNYKNK